MKLFKELPTILPFYTNIKNQDRFKENVKSICPADLISPSDSLLPFMLQIPKDSPKPDSWKLFDLNGNEVADLTNNLNQIKAFNFEDFAFAYYNGQKLTFKFEEYESDLDLSGRFYTILEIAGQKYFSETFLMCKEIKTDFFSDRFVKIVFSDETDVFPLRYRNDFKQVLYLDTFIHQSEPEIEEETEEDGFGNQITVFQKMIIRQRIAVVVPDFLKIAILTLQMHDNVEIFEKNKRSGKIDRIKVSSAIEDFGALSSLDLLFESDVLLKTNCNDNKAIISEIWN